MGLQAVIYQDESGAYCAEVPAFPGCHSCGDTYEEAVENLPEQIAILSLLKDNPSAVTEHTFQDAGNGSFVLSLKGQDLDLRPAGQEVSCLELIYQNHICSYFHKVYVGESSPAEIAYRFSSTQQ